MDFISRYILTSVVLLQALAILRGQNIAVVEAQGEDAPYLLLGNQAVIHKLMLDGTNKRSLQDFGNTTKTPDIRGLDFDFSRGKLYWSDVANDVIMEARLDGTNIRTLVKNGLTEPENIAWDWVNEKLYWTDKDNDTIKVYDPVRDIERTLLFTGVDSNPRAIVVDPSTRYLYWTDWSDGTPRIVKTSMDGQNSVVLANRTKVTWPNALAIDYANQVLYWGDANRDVIGRMNTDGTDARIIASISAPALPGNSHPWAMSYFDGYLFWSDWFNGRSVHKMNVNDSAAGGVGQIETIVTGLGDRPTGIHVVDASRQISGLPNPCSDDNGGCSHLCLLSAVEPAGFSCTCPNDIQLNANGKFCGELPLTTTKSSTSVSPTGLPPSRGPCNISRPCQNGAKCLNINNGVSLDFYCDCVNGYSGKNCQIEPIRTPAPAPASADNSNTIVIVLVLVIGALLFVVITAFVLVILVYIFYKLKTGNSKERSQSLSALSTTSSRDSPTHIVVLRNGRIQTEHDYASIKSRDSPAPKGGFVIYNFPNGSGNPGNPYVIPHPSESPFHRPMVSNGTLNGFLGSSVEKSDSSTKESDNEPLYSNIKTKTNTL